MFNTEDDSNLTAHLEVLFYTPWCPPTGIFVKWIDKYTELDFRLTFYEPGCCFAGEFNNKNKEFNDEYYGTEDEISYIQFILNEGFEELDYYKMILEEEINSLNDIERDQLYDDLIEYFTYKKVKVKKEAIDVFFDYLELLEDINISSITKEKLFELPKNQQPEHKD